MAELRWGLTLPFAGVPLAAHEPLVRRAEELGYDDLWTGETNRPDGFTPLALAAAWTSRMRLGTGVVNPFTRGPAVLAQHAAALADASGGRFVLGLGSSSNVIVQEWNERVFERPLLACARPCRCCARCWAEAAGRAASGSRRRPPNRCRTSLRRCGTACCGWAASSATETSVNFLPLSAVGHVVARVREGEAAAGRGETEIVCRFFCLPGDGLATARFMFAAYATVPVYEAFFRGLGWGDAIDPMVTAWRAGDRKGAAAAAPEELLREIFLFGDAAAMRARLGQFAAGGITTPVLTPIVPADEIGALLEALAP